MGACGGSHHWARELTVLGHEVRLLQTRYVKAFNIVMRINELRVSACPKALRMTAPFLDSTRALSLLFRYMIHDGI